MQPPFLPLLISCLFKDKDQGAGALQKEEEERNGKWREEKKKNKEAQKKTLAPQITYAA
jgi:hypothetical protein